MLLDIRFQHNADYYAVYAVVRCSGNTGMECSLSGDSADAARKDSRGLCCGKIIHDTLPSMERIVLLGRGMCTFSEVLSSHDVDAKLGTRGMRWVMSHKAEALTKANAEGSFQRHAYVSANKQAYSCMILNEGQLLTMPYNVDAPSLAMLSSTKVSQTPAGQRIEGRFCQ